MTASSCIKCHSRGGSSIRTKNNERCGAIAVLFALLLLPLLALAALAIDLGYVAVVGTELQATADSAALAGVSQLLDQAVLQNGSETTAMTNARNVALQYGKLNFAGGVSISIDPNTSNALTGDLLIGYLPNPTNFSSTVTTNAGANTPFNAVQVVTRRSPTLNGTVPLFFSPIFGNSAAQIAASATAVYQDGISGFQITGNNPAVTTSKLIPFAININAWKAVLNGTNSPDLYSFNAAGNTVALGSDGIEEGSLLTSTPLAPGNYGTLVIGSPSNSITDLQRQILNGPNATDLSYYGGTLTLGSTGAITMNGSSGFPAALNTTLQQIIGQPRIAFLYDSVSSNGANTAYNIVGFAGIVIVDSNLLRAWGQN